MRQEEQVRQLAAEFATKYLKELEGTTNSNAIIGASKCNDVIVANAYTEGFADAIDIILTKLQQMVGPFKEDLTESIKEMQKGERDMALVVDGVASSWIECFIEDYKEAAQIKSALKNTVKNECKIK